MANPQFKKQYDAALFTYAVLRYLGAGSVDSFRDRLRSQKIQYLAQSFRTSPSYRFSLYIWGPYSPDLAYDLFEMKKYNIEPKLGKVIPDQLQARLLELKKFLKGKTIRELELLATLHWLIKVGSLPQDRALSRLSKLKTASQEECNRTLKQLKEIWPQN